MKFKSSDWESCNAKFRIKRFLQLKIGAQHVSKGIGDPLAEGLGAALNFQPARHSRSEEAAGIFDGDVGFVNLAGGESLGRIITESGIGGPKVRGDGSSGLLTESLVGKLKAWAGGNAQNRALPGFARE